MVPGSQVNIYFEYADRILAERIHGQNQGLVEAHVPKDALHNGTIVALNIDRKHLGHLEYGLFWGEIPFLNHIFINTDFRNQGYGKSLFLFWQLEMKKRGHNLLLTCSCQNRPEFHFFLKMGCQVSGSFIIDDSMLQIMLSKKI
jgi:hypothetical protein